MKRTGCIAICIIPLLSACGLLPSPTPVILQETAQVEVTRLVEVTKIAIITNTPEPTLTPTSEPKIILEESFDASDGDWGIGVWDDATAEVKDGVLFINVLEPNTSRYITHPELAFLNAPFELELDMLCVSGASDAIASIVFRLQNSGAHAALSLSNNGSVLIGMGEGDDYYFLIPWTRFHAVERGKNHIRIIDDGVRVIAYINDVLLLDIPFQDLPLGSLGLFVITYDGGGATWAFDNIVTRLIGR